jgi:hypothetical protein
MPGPAAAKYPVAGQLLDYLLDAWSRYSRSTVVEDGRIGRAAVANLENYSSALVENQPTQIRRHEAWRLAYRAARYLADKTVDDLMAHGQSVFAELGPQFLIGTEKKGDLAELMQRWTEFLEECELRNLDMRQFKPRL